MADPPPIRRPPTAPPKPPPIPRAPAAAATEVPVMLEEDTKDVGAASAAALVENILELVAAETAFLLEGRATDERLADLNVRTALASWDALDRPDEAARMLELAEGHPLAARLRFAAALATNDLAALDRGGDSAGRRASSARLEARLAFPPDLATDAAEALLWRHGELARSAALAERTRNRTDTSDAIRASASEVLALARAANHEWPEVVALRRGMLHADLPPRRLAGFAALVLDRAGAHNQTDIAAVLEACVQALDRADIQAERAAAADSARAPEAPVEDVSAGPMRAPNPATPDALAAEDSLRSPLTVRLRAERGGTITIPPAPPTRTRTGSFTIPRPTGGTTPPTTRIKRPSDDPMTAGEDIRRTESHAIPVLPSDDDALGWLRVVDIAIDAATRLADPRRGDLLDRRARRIASLSGGLLDALATRHAAAAERARRGDHAEAATRYAQLAGDPANQLGRATGRLALLQAAWSATAGNRIDLALAMHRRLADSECAEVASTHAWRAFELATASGQPTSDLARVLADVTGPTLTDGDAAVATSPTPDAVTRLEQRGGPALRAAAFTAERLGDKAGARAMWRRAVLDDTTAAKTARDELARLLRGDDDDELSAVYGSWAEVEPNVRGRAALQTARGVVDLSRGDMAAAEAALTRAAQLDARDAFCRAGLVSMFRAQKKPDRLAAALADLATTLASKDARAAVVRERAQILEHLGDPSAARKALESVVADAPDDTASLSALADAHERDGDLDRAVELRLRAVNAAGTPQRRAQIWIDVSRAQDKRGDHEAALAALDRASDLAPSEQIARERIRLLRAAGKLDRSLAEIRRSIAADPPLAARLELQRDLAAILTEQNKEPEAVVAAYLDILSHEPDQSEALAGIEAPARALGLWDELARAFRGAKQTPRNLEVLAEALEKIAEWSELAEVRRRQLESAQNPVERARRASELANLYLRELGDSDAAARMLALAQSLDFDPARQKDLLRLLREAQRWADLAQVIERELTRPIDDDRRVDLLLELGELRASRLARPADAVTAYEAVIAVRSDDPLAASALEKLYEQLGRERELAGILESRAEATKDATARAQLFARIAGLRAKRGEVDAAIAAYGHAFKADPANREIFTAMERVAYKAERWAEVMDLYATALAHVESGASRAYRLGDLYSRRANVELNFLGNAEAAMESYAKVIEVDSQPANAAKSLEDLCTQRGDFTPLIVAWEKRAEHQKDPQRRADALRMASRLASEHSIGDHRLSVRLQKKLLAVDPADTDAAAELERYYEDSSDTAGLIDVLKMRLAAAITPDDTVALLKKIARVSEEGARDVDTATDHYRKILEIQKDNREALDALARIYESTEQWSEYIDVTRELIKVTTDRNTKALLFFRCGSVAEAKFGREHEAIRYYHHAIRTSSQCLPAVHGLRDLYRRREEWARVIETLELEVSLWQDDKERAGVLAQIARVYDKQLGDRDRAMQFYDSALAVDKQCLPANLAMFEVHFDRAEWDAALPLAQALKRPMEREGDPTTRGEFYFKLGVVAAKTGDYATAADSLRASLGLRPNDPHTLDELNALSRAHPDAYDFHTIYQTLEKEYRKSSEANPLLARVLIARAAVVERDGDLDQAVALYRNAVELAPADRRVLMALVDFHVATRGWALAIAAIERFCATGETTPDDRVVAMMRQAEILADGVMDAPGAIAVLEEIIRVEPAHQEAHYLLAQESFLAGRHAEGRAAIDRVIELATAPGQPLVPEALARYYYYKGRLLDAAGDARAAAPQYRRASEYDPGYAPPALVLARRAADGGDQRQAEALLIEAAHAAMAQGGPKAAVPLQRGLARILLASGDRTAAIEAYRGILNVDPEGASDRVALAEIYAVEDPARAIVELRRVIDRDIYHAPAYRLLAAFYTQSGQVERANRVLTVLDQLGFAEDADRASLQRLHVASGRPPTFPLDPDVRSRTLLTSAATDVLGEVFGALAQELSATIVPPSVGEQLQPATAVDPHLAQLAAEVAAIYQLDEINVFVGEKVPGLAAATAFPQRIIVIDRVLLTEREPALRFLLGMAFEAIRGGYAALLQMGARERRELVLLLRALVAPEPERTAGAAELLDNADPRARKIVDRAAGRMSGDIDASSWIDGMLACAKRAGLVACDDFGAAVWMIARLAGEQPDSAAATAALGAVLGGADLVRFFLGDAYQTLRDNLAGP